MQVKIENQQNSKNEMKIDIHKKPTNFDGFGRIVGFFCLIMVLAFILNLFIFSGLRKIKTSEFGVWNKIVEGKINADILIGGSSRALNHYDPRIIQNRTGLTAFNIGLNGSQTDMQIARFKTYLQHNKKPSLFIFNLDLFSFQITHGGVYDPGQYLPYLQEEAIYQALKRINPETWKARYIPLYGYAVEDLRFTWLLGMMNFFKQNPAEDHFLGFNPRSAPWTNDFEHFKEINPSGVNVTIEQNGINDMEELLRLCKDQGITTLMVYSPEYKDMQAFTTNRTQVFDHFSELGKRFSVPLWDFSNSVISSRKEYFYNSQHLNAEGAFTFSTEFAARIVSDPLFGKTMN